MMYYCMCYLDHVLPGQSRDWPTPQARRGQQPVEGVRQSTLSLGTMMCYCM
jgi:hypothetical protein